MDIITEIFKLLLSSLNALLCALMIPGACLGFFVKLPRASYFAMFIAALILPAVASFTPVPYTAFALGLLLWVIVLFAYLAGRFSLVKI